MTGMIRKLDRALITERGWQPGSDLEDAVARRLSRSFLPDEVAQQHCVGRYRLDFAWPDLMIALEVDGWHHLAPERAAKDAERDAWLRDQGWLIFRVDDRHGRDSLDRQVVRVCALVHTLRGDRPGRQAAA
ncbi:DUF559 domain-containing protein [Verrucosispora sp. WMMD1129]|uniref:endonuclease domain-containing protein n=1 Tax=Verrucosispora sp. WMMD1129 TaxID=3016093 RepID=UPI00249BC7C0|nr:DUF559 domain-containing protein [Verrucosispora sp. WMMD1129]WFE44156.1 DUF559 domain-containing protein [Verrucosispora sp. WMMD1129]